MAEKQGKVIDYSGPRYAFTKSKDPFEGLEQYSKAPILPMKSYKINFPTQESAFEGLGYSTRDLSQKEGHFFVTIGQARNGGQIELPRGIEDKTRFSKPDIMRDSGKRQTEVKGIHYQDRITLYDSQMARYCMSHLIHGSSLSLDFAIFRHNVKDIGKKYRKGGLKWLVETFPKQIRSAIYLPFPLVFSIWDPRKTTFTRGFDKRGNRGNYTPLNSSILNVLLVEPERVLSLLQEDESDYDFSRYRFSGRVSSNGTSFNQFPVAVFNHLSERSWINNFREEFSGKNLSFFENELVEPGGTPF